MKYIVNPANLGPGGSLRKGLKLARGSRIVISNDDALAPPNLLRECDAILESDERVGCIGFRAVESGYAGFDGQIGSITRSGGVVGNFHRETSGPIPVEHVYGFCYLITREALDLGGCFDRILLSRTYASGDRIETDQCLTIGRSGLKVVYAGNIPVVHLAMPRTDMSERSERWRVNHIRNTMYLYLKHFGVFGRGAIALRFGLSHDVGAISLIKRPTASNARYFLVGLQARASAVAHWLLYLGSSLARRLGRTPRWEQ